jgi:diaminopimelate epimerase
MDGMEVSAVNTGVPHAVIFVDDLDIPISDLAPSIRHSDTFPLGANVNFVRVGEALDVRTFERGVEGETLSCGTGSVACAAVARRLGLAGDEVLVNTMGGPLIVSFEDDRAFLDGPAVTVFSGELSLEYTAELLRGEDEDL